ncbi:hypothetical protein LCGC14_0275650 [marine sediment metagenome]|uniref:Uncharacterized protein n=1 Tax=marine sediment metagenome TaxID=412755 RepID=A0A0F9TXM7_9ZZZZ
MTPVIWKRLLLGLAVWQWMLLLVVYVVAHITFVALIVLQIYMVALSVQDWDEARRGKWDL